GEICVAGDGVCRGYLNRLELTSEKFIDNPFGNKSKLYCSGDLGRILPNGEIEYMGRIDNQVKIRGFRIELGEIEAKLRENINIREAIVLPKKTNNINTLYAYIISNDKPDITEIRSFLAEELPYYMIPSYFIEITEIPYTSNRKIDRKKLLAMDSVIESNKAFEEGNNSAEEIMIDIWKNVLSHSKVGRNDNFFELGGDSIKAIQVVSRLKKYNLSLDVKMLMKNPILSEVSKYVKEDKSTISQGEVTGNILLTPIQMEFLNNNVEVNKFNHAITVETKEKLDNSLIKEMFEILVKHHDALRMKYSYDGKEFLQNNEPYKEGLFNFSSVDISNYSDYEVENIIKDVLDEKNEIINITDGLLMSVTVFHGREKSYISIIVHHLVIDGVSWRILLEDIENIFVDLQKKNKVNLPKKTTSFKQWANELNSYAQTNEVKKECEYWNGVVSGDKGSNKETVNYECDMKKVSAALSKDKTDKLLYEVNSKYGTEINDILLVALGRAIQSWEDCDRTVVSLEGHGRNYNFQSVDISNTIGWFTINYPIILKSYKDKDLSYEIRDVKEMLIKIPNEGLNYCLLKHLTKEGNIEFKEYTPKYSFNYMGQYTEKKESVFSKSDMSIGKTIGDKNITMFDIDINSVIEKEKFIITFRFNENKYKEESVQSLAKIYIESLENIIEHCIAKTEKMLSPSDLCYTELSIDEFDDLLEDLELLEV
ncbi:MAG: condensation domain-containing protein, partial [Clostridium sp.]